LFGSVAKRFLNDDGFSYCSACFIMNNKIHTTSTTPCWQKKLQKRIKKVEKNEEEAVTDTDEKTQMSIPYLTDDVIFRILSYTVNSKYDLPQLLEKRLVCRRWRDHCESEELWTFFRDDIITKHISGRNAMPERYFITTITTCALYRYYHFRDMKYTIQTRVRQLKRIQTKEPFPILTQEERSQKATHLSSEIGALTLAIKRMAGKVKKCTRVLPPTILLDTPRKKRKENTVKICRV